MKKNFFNVTRPKLTLPPEAASMLREEYGNAAVILEYGSGGSTVVASETPGKTIFSVESDANWANMLITFFQENPQPSYARIHHVDIGETAKWGYPVNDQYWERFPDYSLSVWKRKDFLHPSVVLIDGRFRVGCFFATIFSITQKTTILFDDYVDRTGYHIVEKFFRPTHYAGRMAKFEVEPTNPSGKDIQEIIRKFFIPY